MVRHALLALLALGLLTVPRAVEAQPVDRSVRIGLLSPGSTGEDIQAFLRGMHDLGYVDGRNLVVVSRSAHGRTERFTELLGELVRLKVDVIVTGGTAGALAAKQATTTIPVVIGAMGDPVESGVVASLARPGGNITGLSMAMSAEFATKYLDLIRQVLPKASGMGVMWHPSMRIQVQGIA